MSLANSLRRPPTSNRSRPEKARYAKERSISRCSQRRVASGAETRNLGFGTLQDQDRHSRSVSSPAQRRSRNACSVSCAEDVEVPRRDLVPHVVVGKVVVLLAQVAWLVVMADDDPEHDVVAARGVERADGVDGLEAFVGAVAHADVPALLDCVPAIDGDPDVTRGILVAAGELRKLDVVAAVLPELVLALCVADSPFPRFRGVGQQLALRRDERRLVAAGIIERVVVEDLGDVAGEAVDVEVEPEIEVVDVRRPRSVRIQLAAHRDLRVDAAVPVEHPVVDVLVPPALEFRGDREVGGGKVRRRFRRDDHGVGVLCGVPAEGPRVRRAAALRAETVLVAVLRRRRLRAGVRPVVRDDCEGRGPTPEHAPTFEVREPDLEPAALELADPPIDPPPCPGREMVITPERHALYLLSSRATRSNETSSPAVRSTTAEATCATVSRRAGAA